MTSVLRLNTFFQPSHYAVLLDLNETDKTFTGRVDITGKKLTPDQPIRLHAKDIDIESVTVNDEAASFSLGDHDEMTIESDTLPVGEYTVAVRFSGSITEQMHGLYPCFYEHNGVKKELLATQFESHHAREVFPCIDEPAAKATFDLNLVTSANQVALSNMPVSSQETTNGRMTTSFATSPMMSTYLLAFVVGDLQKKSATTKDGVEVNIWSVPTQPLNSLDFALDIAVRAIEFYDDYFGTPYPLPKSDHVALPDFSSGAMENWGLITYRETCLLADATTTSIASRHYIATVITHELAHQWFGNLVTMEWWNDLWLNESFASLMEYISLDALHPEWNIWLDFVTHDSVAALRRDSIDGVQSVQVDVTHPDEISTLFDGAIVYAKGARLLRMIQQFIGDDAFRTGLKQYFADHAYKNTVGNDLWFALENASGEKVSEIMNTWISQSGYPVITVEKSDSTVTLSQKQFFIGPHTDTNKVWPIPLNANDVNIPKLLSEKSETFTYNGPVRLNVGDSSHFITRYDHESQKNMIDMVANGSLDPIGRVQLLDEATLLARGGIIGSEELIPLVLAYKDETLESVWDIIGLALAELRKFVDTDKDAEQKLRSLSAFIAKNEYERLGWEYIQGEPEEDTKLRSSVIALTLYGEVPEAVDKAKKLYETTDLDKIDPELRALVISSVARYDDGKVVDELLDVYRKTHSGELKQDICVGITSTRVPEKISLLLDSMKDSNIVRAQDAFRWFVYLIRGKESRDQAWQWIRNNWDWVDKTFGGDKSYDDFPRYSANGLSTRTQLQEYIEFFEPKKNIPALSRVVTMGISEIEGRVELIERDKSSVIESLLSLELNK
jgi:aminopeptidase N